MFRIVNARDEVVHVSETDEIRRATLDYDLVVHSEVSVTLDDNGDLVMPAEVLEWWIDTTRELVELQEFVMLYVDALGETAVDDAIRDVDWRDFDHAPLDARLAVERDLGSVAALPIERAVRRATTDPEGALHRLRADFASADALRDLGREDVLPLLTATDPELRRYGLEVLGRMQSESVG